MTSVRRIRLPRALFGIHGMGVAYIRAGRRWPPWRDRLVLIHGSGCSADAWRYQLDGLSRHVAVMAVDLPGHGDTRSLPEPTIRRYADTVAGLLQQRGWHKAFLAGHSMGGAVALQVALEHPELLKGVILVATTAYLDALALTPKVLLWAAAALPHKFRGMFFSNGVSPEALDIAREDMRRCSLETILSDFSACRTFDFRGRLKGLGLPTLILCGGEDHITPPRHSERLHREIAGSSYVLIPEVGHMLPLEAPDQVNAAIRAFIEQH